MLLQRLAAVHCSRILYSEFLNLGEFLYCFFIVFFSVAFQNCLQAQLVTFSLNLLQDVEEIVNFSSKCSCQAIKPLVSFVKL